MKTPVPNQDVVNQCEHRLGLARQYYSEGKFDLSASEAIKTLDLTNHNEELYWQESMRGYQALRNTYYAKGDEVNVAAITNFISAIYSQHGNRREIVKTADQLRIDKIRQETKSELEACSLPTKAPYPNEDPQLAYIPSQIENIYKDTSDKLREFVKDLIQDIQITKLGNPPHNIQHAIICFGSLARNEATPYSDLEFGVLLDESFTSLVAPQQKEIKDYWRNLTKELNIRIIDLGETTIKIQNIPEIQHLKSPTKNGFSFDGRDRGGCKTPLGNAHHIENDVRKLEREIQEVGQDSNLSPQETENKISELRQKIENVKAGEFELICTPSQMAEFHNESWYNRDNHMSTVLLTSKFISGNSLEIEAEYKKKTNEVLDKEIELSPEELAKEEEIRARRLSLGEEYHFPTLRERRATNLLRESLDRFKLKAGRTEADQSRSFSPKYDFYRPAVMIIDHLSLLYKVEGNSVWERFDQLFVGDETHPPKLPINNQKGVDNLKWMLDRTSQIRMNNYLSNNNQIEEMPLIEDQSMSEEQREERIRKGLGISMNDLFEIYYVMFELEDRVNSFTQTIEHDFNKISFLNSDYRREDDYVRARIYGILNHTDKAILYHRKDINDRSEKISSEQDLYIFANSLEGLGMALVDQGNSNNAEAIEIFGRVLAIRIETCGENNPVTAYAYHNLGSSYDDLNEAENFIKKAIQIDESYFGRNTSGIANYLNSLGIAQLQQGKYDEAIETFCESCQIFRNCLGKNCLDLSKPLHNLALTYLDVGEAEKATESHQESLEIKQFYLGQYHPKIARSFYDFATKLAMKGDVGETTINYFEQAIRIIRPCADQGRNDELANYLNNFGAALCRNGAYEAAADVLKESIAIKDRVFGKHHHQSFEPLRNLILSYQKREIKEAPELIEAIFSIAQNTYQTAEQHEESGKTTEAIIYFRKSKEIFETVYGHQHKNTCLCLYDLARNLYANEQYEEAIKYTEESLEIEKNIFGVNHPEVIKSMDNLAKVYYEQDYYGKAANLFSQIVEIKKQALGEDHPETSNYLDRLNQALEQQEENSSEEDLANTPSPQITARDSTRLSDRENAKSSERS